ncbi:MAG: extracellular solute-binding protein [Candidatus Paceibacterota bacterium]
MKISLFQGILIGIFGAGALVGLFVFATYSGGGAAEDSVGSVLVWGTLPKGQIDSALTEVTTLDSSMKSVKYVQKSADTLATDLSAAIATDQAPDLVLASHEQLYSMARFIEVIPESTLSQRTFTDSFIKGGSLFAEPNGRGYYGLPFLVDPLVLYWNNDILASSGIARPPATWDALTGLVPKIAELTPTRQITRGLIALGTYDNVRNARAILSAIFLQSNVPMINYSATGLARANLGEEAVTGTPPGQAVLSFYTQFADPSKVSYTWNASLPDSQKAFQTGDLALYVGYASEARTLAAANPNLSFNVAPLPQPATATIKATYGLVYAFMIPRGAKNPSGAYVAAATLSSSAEQTIAARATGLAPATRNALAALPSDPFAAVAYSSALYTEGWLSPLASGTDQVFSTMIGSVVSGRSESAAALSKAAGALSLLLQQ